MPGIDVLTPGNGQGVKMASVVDDAVQSSALSGMSVEASAASTRRVGRFDQLGADSAAMWAVALTTPTVFAGMGFRVAQQSAGFPSSSGTGTGGTDANAK